MNNVLTRVQGLKGLFSHLRLLKIIHDELSFRVFKLGCHPVPLILITMFIKLLYIVPQNILCWHTAMSLKYS